MSLSPNNQRKLSNSTLRLKKTTLMLHTTLCLKKNDNDVLRYNFNTHQPILVIFTRMLLSEYAIEL